ncbi:hypothetical protein DL93DRAFT_2165803 [Clavulina sp. PMI_390]|nr:hypothetical protein DL93DRAFT_2165803 [Clavulina sp. PMI_390]
MGSLKDKLTIAIDVGTSQSAVAVAYVSKGDVTFSLESLSDSDLTRDLDGTSFSTLVDSWPGQQNNLQLARVPTALLYSEDDNLLACGAEVQQMLQATNFQLEDSPRYKRPQYFKTVLHPEQFAAVGKSLHFVFLFIRLQIMLQTRAQYLGFDPWITAREDATIVLSHPNKWRAAQQLILRQAAIAAGLVTPRDVTSRLHFVEEAEAAASFALLEHPGMKDTLKAGVKFVVCDAGGSTVDISSYVVKSQKSHGSRVIEMDELATPFSLDAGGIYVDLGFSLHFVEVLASYLSNNPQEHQILLDDAMNEFEGHSKRRFTTPGDTMHVRFGPRGLNIPEAGVRKGTFEIPGPTATTFFQPSLEATAAGLLGLKRSQDASVIILTGGFAESPYFKRVIRERLEVNPGCRIILANHPMSKAVVVGALALTHGMDQRIKIKRKPRGWKTWISELFIR